MKSINSSTIGNYRGYFQAHSVEIDDEIALIGPGTPSGEFFRRYWHPVSLTSDIGDAPLPVRILGEDLVLFRTTAGQIGLVHRQCPHRRASLVYGRCEKNGIRCCYHGWLFSPDGEILDCMYVSDVRIKARFRGDKKWTIYKK